MSLLRIRDAVTGDVVMDENDFISRHLMSIEIAFNDTDKHSILVPGLDTGTPYYIFDPQSNVYIGGITNGMNTTMFFNYIEVSFSGNTVTYQQKYITSLSSGGLTNVAGPRSNTWLHIGIY